MRLGPLLYIGLLLSVSQSVLADYRSDVELSQYSEVVCGERISNDAVMMIEMQSLLEDKDEAAATVRKQVPEHGLESPVPVLVEQVHWRGRVTRKALLRNAIRESAMRGCNLLIVLDMDVREKAVIRPGYMDLKLPVSYVLVLLGTQVKKTGTGKIE